ncbi:MAG: UDP-N-acetylmuramoyl-L-alanyl-D-glutamate--2,6-diaminopimelate ligase [Maribacter sp.]|jgi:UDP-N-acetylmuramoyl-L-alanyl-D-glutamate--2,6-diaminopimelate ligase
MKLLKDILSNITTLELHGNEEVQVNGLAIDSRKAKDGYVFIAVEGTQIDGHLYIDAAIKNGALIIVCETLPAILLDHITYCQVKDSKKATGLLAAEFFEHPSKKLSLIGVTGTNGKTTTVTLLYKLFSEMGYKTGLISTIENKIGQATIPSTHTTPDAISLNELLAEMVEANCDYAFMEVSSHAIVQERIAGVHFEGGVFTNLSHDHLDYHKNFANYLAAKKQFFDNLPKSSFALTNIDDRRGNVMLQNTKAKKYPYALKSMATFKAKIIENSLSGLQLYLDGTEFHGRLIGEFNAYNYLAVYATSMLLEMDKMEVLTALSSLLSAEGRFDYIYSNISQKIGIIDYAHTPDALEKVLITINQLKQKNTQILTVVGCGGDRDKRKRPIMADMACTYSNKVILTSDNPRSEHPETIIEEMEKGVKITDRSKVLNITDRKQAIKTACALAQSGDIILVAGKGHEKYQETKGVKNPFDDKEILNEFLKIN